VQVFISHSSKDKPAVEALALALRDYRTAKDSIAVSFIPPSVLSPLRSHDRRCGRYRAVMIPSTDVFSQNTNVSCLVAYRRFRYLPGICRPLFIILSIRL